MNTTKLKNEIQSLYRYIIIKLSLLVLVGYRNTSFFVFGEDNKVRQGVKRIVENKYPTKINTTQLNTTTQQNKNNYNTMHHNKPLTQRNNLTQTI